MDQVDFQLLLEERQESILLVHLLQEKVKFSFQIVNYKFENDGSLTKFVDNVYKIVFSGHQAIKYGQEILYITERAVFKLTARGLILEEIAPGIDLDKDILSKMNFMPKLGIIKEMDPRLFKENKMGLKEEFLQKIKR